jgi:NADH-quinone oxidoreductase subunit G
MATIEIDGNTYAAQAGQMLIEVADAAGIVIPRFCYHKKLSVAANCRMCLVEVEKAPKPMPACATPVMDGMKVYTRSPKALAAQQAVMEFLLINHPLDCPICDQGGECELQDVAVGFGGDASHYHEAKRVVADKNLGPLIATEMTRCIHCTRCVRFGEEIAGIRELGATGRGEHTRIGTYIEKTVDFELSGNVIDLCPVGALTSKPFRFQARAWEMRQYDTIAPHDAVGSNLHVHVRRNQVLRVAPKENEAVNEVWIADRDRFSYQGLYAEDRLRAPMIKKDGTWQECDWETALTFAAEGLQKVKNAHGSDALGALASPTATLEELYLLQKLMRGLGSHNLDHRVQQNDFRDQDHAPLFPYLGQAIADLENLSAALIIGSHLRKEQPLLNHRLRKAAIAHGAAVMWVNPLDYDLNFPPAAKIVSAPVDLPQVLAGIVKALLEAGADAVRLPAGMADLLENIEITPTQRDIAAHLRAAEGAKTVMLGRLAATDKNASVIRACAATIALLSDATLAYADGAANSAGAWLAGMVPHRGAGGTVLSAPGKHAAAMLEEGLSAYVLLGLEPELDSCCGENALTALNKADFVLSLSAFRTPVMESYADVILPIALFAETGGTYVNCEGRAQSFNGAVTPPGDARPAWKILRVLGNLLALEGFDYVAVDEVGAEVQAYLPSAPTTTLNSWQIPTALPTATNTIQRIAEMPIYSVDALSRRARALQQTADMAAVQGIRINPALAAKMNLSAEGAQALVRQNGKESILAVHIDSRVPDNCALIYAGQSAHIHLGTWHGPLEVAAA